MKKITLVWAVILIIIIAAGAYWYLGMPKAAPDTAQQPSPSDVSVSGSAGINGSVNQGNLGQPDTGSPQQPQQY